MKSHVFTLTAILALFSFGFAVGSSYDSCCDECYSSTFCDNCCSTPCCDPTLCFDIGTGYRQDTLRWAFPGFSPGEAIHEKWDNLSIGFIELNARARFCDCFLFTFDFDYGWSGWDKQHRTKLVDYNSDVITHHPKTKAKAEVYDVSLGIGRQLCLSPCWPFILTPTIGWSYNHQRLKNGSYYFHGRHTSKYSWNSGWAGFDILYKINCKMEFFFDYAFHAGSFHATVNEFFRDRRHNRAFLGNEVETGIGYKICDCFAALKFNYKQYWTSNKKSVTDSFDGSLHRRRVNWDSWSIAVDIGCCF